MFTVLCIGDITSAYINAITIILDDNTNNMKYLMAIISSTAKKTTSHNQPNYADAKLIY